MRTQRSQQLARLDLPVHLEQPQSTRSLMFFVSNYFYKLYNVTTDNKFRPYLASTGNKDSLTLNLGFDRHNAVLQIYKLADEDGCTEITGAPEGKVYDCVVKLLRRHNLGRRARRREQLIRYSRSQEAAE